jgi:hypothetical protein
VSAAIATIIEHGDALCIKTAASLIQSSGMSRATASSVEVVSRADLLALAGGDSQSRGRD